jgi:hypothetical protein
MAKRVKLNATTDEAVQNTTEETTGAVEAPKKAKEICVVPSCGREAKIRGLCGRCCTAARKAVADGKTTWKKLEAAGLAKAPRHQAHGVFAEALGKLD